MTYDIFIPNEGRVGHPMRKPVKSSCKNITSCQRPIPVTLKQCNLFYRICIAFSVLFHHSTRSVNNTDKLLLNHYSLRFCSANSFVNLAKESVFYLNWLTGPLTCLFKARKLLDFVKSLLFEVKIDYAGIV